MFYTSVAVSDADFHNISRICYLLFMQDQILSLTNRQQIDLHPEEEPEKVQITTFGTMEIRILLAREPGGRASTLTLG